MTQYGIVSTIANEKDNLEEFINALNLVTKDYDAKIFLVFDRVCSDGSYELSQSLEKKYSNLNTIFCRNSTCQQTLICLDLNMLWMKVASGL